MNFLGDLMPESMYDVISSTVLDIISNQRGGLLTFGFLFSLYLSTNGMMALMRSFNSCYKTTEKRSGLKMRMVATLLTINMAVVSLDNALQHVTADNIKDLTYQRLKILSARYNNGQIDIETYNIKLDELLNQLNGHPEKYALAY